MFFLQENLKDNQSENCRVLKVGGYSREWVAGEL